jgi:predicted RNase H-like nuclease (RuvC/YqgF family)
MSSDAPKLGTGLFGFRRSAVKGIMAEDDERLREAEERLRAAETRVSELQQELDSLKRRNAQMNQEIERFETGAGAAEPDVSPEPVQSGRGSWEGGLERQ